jgi:hypothetical protein
MPYELDQNGKLIRTTLKTQAAPEQLSNTMDVDLSKYEDYLAPGESYIKGEYDQQKWDDNRARNQSGTEKALNSIGQGVGTFGTALASGVGALVSGAAALGAEAVTGGEAEGMDIFLNNPFMKGIDDFDKYIKNDLVPTYYTKDQQDRIFSAATGTDLLNGVGFMMSAIIPSQAITKLFGSMAKLATAAKVGRAGAVIDAAVAAGEATAVEGKIISSLATRLNAAGPIVGAVVGRIGESSMEAYQTYTQIKESLTAERDQARQEIEMTGKASKPSALLTDEEIENRAKDGRNNVFGGNMVLAASDVLQYSRWFRGAGLGERIAKEGFKSVVKNTTKRELLGSLIKEAGQEAAEEGFQFLLSKGAEKSAKGKSFLQGIEEASGDLFTTVEGQKSMLLGAVLGGGMSSIAAAKNSKETKKQLEQLAQNLTASGDANARYITDPVTGKKIVNPELTKVATTFAFFEAKKQAAAEAEDWVAYEVAEKLQFSTLVESKLQAGQYDDFISDLKEMGTANPEEIKQMFGDLPMRDGREMSPMEVANEKIALAKRIKTMSEGIDALPQFNQVDKEGKPIVPKKSKAYIKHQMFTQESLRDQILESDKRILEIKGRTPSPIFTGDNVTEKPEPYPGDVYALKLENQNRENLLGEFQQISKEFKEFLKTPEKATAAVNAVQEENIRSAVDDQVVKNEKQARLEAEAAREAERIAATAIEPTIISTPNGDIEVQKVGDKLINVETGEEVDVAGQILSDLKDPEELVEKQVEYTPENELPEEYPIKEDIFNTTTRGHEINWANGGERFPLFNAATNLIEWALHGPHAQITEYMSKPENTPSTTNKYSIEITPASYTEAELVVILKDINDRRDLIRRQNPSINLNLLTLADLANPAHLPLRIRILKNGKVVEASEQNILHFHDVDYFFKTQNYTDIRDSEMPEDQKVEAINKRLNELLIERTKVVEQLKNGPVSIDVEAKSKGMLNFLPKDKDGKNQVVSFEKVFGSPTSPKNSGGIGIITSIDEDGVPTVEYEGTGQIVALSDKQYKGRFVAGEIVFEAIAANGTPVIINAITKNEYPQEVIDSLIEMILYKLASGQNKITVNGKKYDLVGKTGNRGLIDMLAYVGISKETPERSFSFLKDSKSLKIGNKVFTAAQVDEARAALSVLIPTYHKYPKLAAGKLVSGREGTIVIPTEINMENGEAKGQEMPYKEFIFGGDNPLIGTNVNPNIPFINSYFGFAKDATGKLKINDNAPAAKPEEPYASNLPGTLTPAPVVVTPVVALTPIEIEEAKINKEWQEALSRVSKKLKGTKIIKTITSPLFKGFSALSINNLIGTELKNGDKVRVTSVDKRPGKEAGAVIYTDFTVTNGKLIESGNPNFNIKTDKRKFGDLDIVEDQYEEDIAQKNKVNEYYKAKLDALKPKAEPIITPEPVSNVEVKKTELERKRQEANNKFEELEKQIDAINYDEVADSANLINKLVKNTPLPANTRINNWILEELNGKLWESKNLKGKEEEFFGKENWDKIKEAKKQFDIEFKKIEDSNLSKINLIEQKQSDLLSTIDGLELRKAWSFGLIEEPNIVGLDETNFISKETEFKNGDLVETDNYEGIYYLSKPDEDGDFYEVILGKTEQEVIDKINAKYAAKPAALEGKPKEVVKETPKEVKKVLSSAVKKSMANYGLTEAEVAKNIKGTGKDGNVVKKDIEDYMKDKKQEENKKDITVLPENTVVQDTAQEVEAACTTKGKIKIDRGVFKFNKK